MLATPLPFQRPRNLLVTVLAFWFLLLSFQAKREGSHRSLIEEWMLALVRPVVSGTSRLIDAVGDAGTGVVDLHDAARENARLRELLRERDLEIGRLRRFESEVGRLEQLLAYRTARAPEGILARVVYTDTRGPFKSLLVDRGAESGLAAGSAALDARGVVGRVVLASGGISKVQLLVDANASAGCLVERNRLQGVLRGDGGAALLVQYVPRGGDVRVGDRILTAGNDGIYPPGLFIGTVVSANEGEGLFREIRVHPAVPINSLEALLVLPPRPLSAEAKEPRR